MHYEKYVVVAGECRLKLQILLEVVVVGSVEDSVVSRNAQASYTEVCKEQESDT